MPIKALKNLFTVFYIIAAVPDKRHRRTITSVLRTSIRQKAGASKFNGCHLKIRTAVNYDWMADECEYGDQRPPKIGFSL